MRTRVLHVLGELRPSGMEMMLCIAAGAFSARGFDSDVVSTGADVGSFAPRLARAGYGVYHVPFAKTPGFFWRLYRVAKAPGYFWRLYRVIRAGRYDVVHLHTEGLRFWTTLVALAARPRCVLQTVHSNFDFTGLLRLRRTIQRRLLHRLGVVAVAIGPSVQKNEQERFGVPTTLVANWYDSARFVPPAYEERARARAALEIGPDAKVAVVVGNCSPIKNHPALLRALSMLPEQRRPLLLHVGHEEDGRPERALAAQLGIEANVRFLGPMDDVRRALHAADIFVMPSVLEGFSIAAMEAVATGLPTLLADVPGLRDLRGVCRGVSYAAPDARSLSAALAQWLDRGPQADCDVRREDACRIRQHFGIEQGVAAYAALYAGRQPAA